MQKQSEAAVTRFIPVAFNAEGENGPASEDLAVDAHNCIMVGVLVHRIQGCGTSHARVPPWNCLHRITLTLGPCQTTASHMARNAVPTCRQASAVLEAVQDASRRRS